MEVWLQIMSLDRSTGCKMINIPSSSYPFEFPLNLYLLLIQHLEQKLGTSNQNPDPPIHNTHTNASIIDIESYCFLSPGIDFSDTLLRTLEPSFVSLHLFLSVVIYSSSSQILYFSASSNNANSPLFFPSFFDLEVKFEIIYSRSTLY